jgi:hypothetical protein
MDKSSLNQLRKGFKSITNEQLAKKAKRTKDKNEEAISNASVKDIIGGSDSDSDYVGSSPKKRRSEMSIGIKPNQSVVTLPDLMYDEDFPIPREDGLEWGEGEYKNHKYYGKEWVDNELNRTLLLENDPDYKFVTLIAGFTQFRIEDLIVEEQNVENRQAFFQNQQSGRVDAMTNIEAIESRIKQKQAQFKQVGEFVDLQGSQLEKVVAGLEKLKLSIMRLRAFEQIYDRKKLNMTSEPSNDPFQMMPTSEKVRYINYVWTYMLEDQEIKNTWVNEVWALVSSGLGATLGDFRPIAARIIGVEDTDEGLLEGIKTITEKKFNSLIESMIANAGGEIDTSPILSDLAFYSREFIMNHTVVDGKRYRSADWSEFYYEIYDGDEPTDMARTEMIIRRADLLETFSAQILIYTDQTTGLYKTTIRNNILLDINAANVVKYGRISLFISNAINVYRTTLEDDRSEARVTLKETRFGDLDAAYGTILAGSSDAVKEVIRFVGESFANQKNITKLLSEIVSAAKGEAKEEFKYYTEKAKQDPLYFLVAYHTVIIPYLRDSLDFLTEGRERLRVEIRGLEKYANDLVQNDKVIQLQEIEYPYRQRPSWVLKPRHSGIIQLAPVVISAIAKAKNMLEQKVDPFIQQGFVKFSNINFEDLQVLSPVNVTLAELVACLMAFPSLDFPGSTYRFKDSRLMATQNLASILKNLRAYRITQSNRGAKGKKNYKITTEKKKDSLA